MCDLVIILLQGRMSKKTWEKNTYFATADTLSSKGKKYTLFDPI